MAGEQIGPYIILSKVGEGGLGEVYRATDSRTGRTVAIKCIKSAFLTGRSQWRQQIETVAALEAPGLAPILDWGEQDGIPYQVTPWMEGGSLAQKLTNGPLPLPQIVRIVADLAPGLDAVHDLGIVHGDIKPTNILFDADGKAFLADFGMYLLATASFPPNSTTLIGPPAYISPEQALGKPLDPRSDIYQLGAVLFEMLTATPPYHAWTALGYAAQQIAAPIPDIRTIRPDLPGSFAASIQLSLAKEPDLRFPRVSDLARLLSTALEDTPFLTEKPDQAETTFQAMGKLGSSATTIVQHNAKTPPPAIPQPAPRPKRRTGLILVLAIVALLAVSFYEIMSLGKNGIGPLAGWELALAPTASNAQVTVPPATAATVPATSELPTTTPSLPPASNTPHPTDSGPGAASSSTPTALVTPTISPSLSPTSTPSATLTPTPAASPTPDISSLPTLGYTNPLTYTIQYNDTIFTIASQFRVDLGELLSVNNMRCDSQLAVSKLLIIPPAVQSYPPSYENINLDTLPDLELLHVLDCLQDASVMRFSTDGRILAVASGNFVYLWQVGDWKPLSRLKGHTAKVLSLAFSDNGEWIATASDDATVRLWQVKDGALVTTLKGHFNSVTDVAFYPGSQMIVATSRDQTVRVWRVDGAELQQLQGYPAFSAAFSPDGATLAVGYADMVRLFQVSDLSLVQKFPSTEVVRRLAFSPDGHLLVSNYNAWQVSDGRQIYTFGNTGDALAFNQDGQLLMVGRSIYHILNGQVKRILKSPVPENTRTNDIWDSVAISPDGGLIAWGTPDSVSIWSLPNGYTPPPALDQKIHTVQAGDNFRNLATLYQVTLGNLMEANGLNCQNIPFLGQRLVIPTADDLPTSIQYPILSPQNITGIQDTLPLDMECILTPGKIFFSADNRLLQSGSALWRIDTQSAPVQAEIVPLNFAGLPDTTIPAPVMVLSPDGALVAIRVHNHAEFWDTVTGRLVRILEGHSATISALAFSLDGQLLATGSGSDGQADSDEQVTRLWNTADGALAGTLDGYTAKRIFFLPDGQHMLVEGDDAMRLWHINDRRLLHNLQGLVGDVAIHPNGEIFAFDSCQKWIDTTCVSHLTSIYNLSDGTVSGSLQGMVDQVQAIRFSPDGTLLAVASGYAINLFNVSDWSLARTLKVQNNLEIVREIEFSPDGQLIVSSADDSSIRFWQVADGKLLHTLHRNVPQDMTFSPDGTLLAIWENTTIKLWAAP